jgi:hypothetical protein
MCGTLVSSRWHIAMRLLTVQVLGVLLLGYQCTATPTDANSFGPVSSAVGEVSIKHDKMIVTALSKDQL